MGTPIHPTHLSLTKYHFKPPQEAETVRDNVFSNDIGRCL